MSFHPLHCIFTIYEYITNSPRDQLPVGLIAELVEHCTGIEWVMGSSHVLSLFTVATAQTHFSFNGSFYDQIDGVAMGSPLAPGLANLFMGHHEKLWLE